MSSERRAGYALALKCGAKKTAARIRANKASMGMAIVSACREIGIDQVTEAIVESENPWWALCAIRYAPLIMRWHRSILTEFLTDAQYKHAKWVLRNFRNLSKDDIRVLKWVSKLQN